MIGKVTLGNSAKGLLEYCYHGKELKNGKIDRKEVRGEIVYIQNLALNTLPNGRFDIHYISKQFLENANKNTNLAKSVWHQSFSFQEGEQISNDQIQEITEVFCKDFGFENNQLIVFRHNDTKNPHFHIVGNRIDYKGKNTSEHFNNFKRTGLFCRKIEQQFGFKIAPQMHILEKDLTKRQTLVSESNLADWLRDSINNHLPKVSTLNELKAALKKEHIKTHIARGIAFTLEDKGVTFKGSELGREFSLQNIGKRIGKAAISLPVEKVVKDKKVETMPEMNLKIDTPKIRRGRGF